jgi:hypothetical protein
MNYQLTQREKILIFVLSIFAVLVGGLMLLIQPALDHKLELQQELDEQLTLQMEMQSNIAQLPQLQKDQQTAKETTRQTGKAFYEPMSTNMVADLISGFLDSYNLSATAMSVSDIRVKDLANGQFSLPQENGYTWGNQIKAAQAGETGSGSGTSSGDSTTATTAQVLYSSITLTCVGERSNFEQFISNIADRLPVQFIQVDVSQTGDFQVTLELYMLDEVQ